MDVRIETREPTPVAFVRHVGPYAECADAWQTLCGWAGPRGLLGPSSQFLGICYDDPKITPEDKIRYDACVCVGDGVSGEGEVGVQEVVGGAYAVVVHRGPYSGFHETFARFYGEWLPASGFECRDAPCLEIYMNDPNQTPEEELLTEIWVPVEKK